METVSEKPKRGRPEGILADPVWGPVAAFATQSTPDLTRRQRQNIAYGMVAWSALKHAPRPERFKWLLDLKRVVSAPERGKARARRAGILSELGRFEDPKLILKYAGQICRLRPRPTTHHAVEILRLCRLRNRATSQPAS